MATTLSPTNRMNSTAQPSASAQPTMRERAGTMFSDGRQRARERPYTAAAIAGGVAATAAAAIYGGAKLAQNYTVRSRQPRDSEGKFK